MQNEINEIINDLNCQLDYVLNNTDFTSNYDYIISEKLDYYRNGKNDYLTIEKYTEDRTWLTEDKARFIINTGRDINHNKLINISE